MGKYGGWAVVGLVVGAALMYYWRTPPVPPADQAINQGLVDSLRGANARLVEERHALEVMYQRADSLRRVEMTARSVAVSAARQSARQLDSARAATPRTLPPQSDSAAQAMYAVVQAQLDSATALIRRQLERTDRDSALLDAGTLREANLRAQLHNVGEQVRNVEAERAEWQTKYQAVIASQSRCQRKCGIALGVAGTVAAAWVVDAVLTPRP